MTGDQAPRLSVLLPVRNADATLASALASIRRQTEHSWECVIVDDGSCDATREIAAAACAVDGRFKLVSTPPRGIVAALNEGLALCAAPYVARMDADDVMHRDRLAAQAGALDADEELAAVGCHVRLFPRESMSPRLREYEAWLNGMRSAADVARDAFVECPIAHPTLTMRRSMAALGYADGDWPEDYDLLLRAHVRGLRVGVVPRRLLAWRNGPASLSRTDARYATGRFTACKARFLAAGFLAPFPRYVLWGYGSTGRQLRQALAALGHTPSHIVEIKRGRLGQRIHGAHVVAPAALSRLRGLPIVVSVARAHPRAEIRRALSEMGFEDGRHFVCAA